MSKSASNVPGSISFLITGLRRGGAEMQLLHLTSRLKTRGWSVQVISMIPPGELAGEFERAGVKVDSLMLPGRVPDPRGIVRLAQLLRRHQPDVVHSHMPHANILARITRITCPVPVLVSTVHSVFEGARWRSLAIRFTDRLCDMTTVVSHAVLHRYRNNQLAHPARLKVVHNGVDVSRFHRDPDTRRQVREELGTRDQFVWLAVGRLTAAKDYPTMFGALRQHLSGHSDSIILIAGDGPERPLLERIVRQLALTPYVRFLGSRSDVPALMSAADAYVLSSAWEGLPSTLLEAAASELPIVATDVGGNSEVIRNGVTGYLVPPADVAALAKGMARVQGMADIDRVLLGKRARSYVQEMYSIEHIVDEWERLYEALLASRRASIRA